MVKLEEPLKAAMSRMPAKEKDKLLFRLVAKDKILVERLVFELLEDKSTTDERAAAIREMIEGGLSPTGTPYFTPGLLLMELRGLSGRITEHVKVTKDRAGEVILSSFLFAEAIRRHRSLLERAPRRADTFAPYLAKRLKTLLPKADKLHEDLHLEFRKDLNEVLAFVWEYAPTRAVAAELQLRRQF